MSQLSFAERAPFPSESWHWEQKRCRSATELDVSEASEDHLDLFPILEDSLGRQIEDLAASMREKEREICVDHERLHCTVWRDVVAEWLLQTGEAFCLGNRTIHGAIRLFDVVLSGFSITKPRLQLLACACLLISSKMNEREEMIPSVKDLNFCTENAYSSELIRQMEALLVQQLAWQVNPVTPIQFLGALSSATFLESDSINRKTYRGDTLAMIRAHLIAHCEKLLQIAIESYKFSHYRPSILACAAVALTRQMVGVETVWSPDLSRISGTQEYEFEACLEHLQGYALEKMDPIGDTTPP